MNSVYTIYNSKICLPKSTNAEKKKKKVGAENVKQKTWTQYANGHYNSVIGTLPEENVDFNGCCAEREIFYFS